MKIKCIAFLGFVVAALAVGGCYKKVSGGTRMGLPFANFAKDKVYGLYEKPPEAVYNAAIQALNRNKASIEREGTEFENQTNAVRTIVARLDQRNVYMRIQPQEANMTLIQVQARTPSGVADLPLAHTLEKEVALQMAR